MGVSPPCVDFSPLSRSFHLKNLALVGIGIGLGMVVMAFCLIRPPAELMAIQCLGWTFAVASLVLLVGLELRRDLVPDYLSRCKRKFFERDGFCFGVSLDREDGRAMFTIFFQSRYVGPSTRASPCGPPAPAWRPSRPTSSAARRGLEWRNSPWPSRGGTRAEPSPSRSGPMPSIRWARAARSAFAAGERFATIPASAACRWPRRWCCNRWPGISSSMRPR